MSVAVMSSKGQLVIPAPLRRLADLGAGDRVVVEFDEATNEIRLRKAASASETIDRLSARVSTWVRPGIEPLEDPRGLYRGRQPKG